MDSPPSEPAIRQRDDEQLRLLAIFHYVVAGFGALFSCFPIIHIVIGTVMVTRPSALAGAQHGAGPPAAIGYLFIVIGAVLVLLGWTASICTLISGRYLAKRRKRMFSFVMAALLCAFVPFGTILGVFTIIVLNRESVQRSYDKP